MPSPFIRPWQSLQSPHQFSRPLRASKSFNRSSRRFCRYLYLRFLRLKGSPAAIARGLAVGAFSSMFPFFGFQMIMGVLLAMVVKGNKLAAMAATWISNPFTYVPIYAMNYHIGRLLLRMEAVDVARQGFRDWNHIVKFGSDVAGALLVGSCITGIVVGFLVYGLGYRLSSQFRQRQLRHLKQQIRQELLR